VNVVGTLATWITIIGFPLVIVSLVLLIRQTRELTKQNETAAKSVAAAVYQNVSDLMIQIDRVFLEYPELRPYFDDGAALPNDVKTRSQVIAVAEMLADFRDNVMAQSRAVPTYRWGMWKRYFDELEKRSPAFKEYLEKNDGIYSHDWAALEGKE